MKAKMNFHIITLFPDAISGYIQHSILKKAISDGKITVNFYDPKDFTDDKTRVDDKPYGGGPGMVMKAMPVIRAIENAKGPNPTLLQLCRGKGKKVKIMFMSPQGEQFTNEYADKVAEDFTDVIIVSGRYEGIDARVKEVFPMDEVSIGPFVLTGGELPAMIICDVISRRVPGVLGNFDSVEETRHASSDVYTRPSEFIYNRKKYTVPDVLLSGHHAELESWREGNSKHKKPGKN